MTPKLIEKGEMILVGVMDVVSSGTDIHRLWQQFTAHESALTNAVENVGYELQIYPEGHTAGQPFQCLVGIEVATSDPLPPSLFAKTIPACQYAVFPHRPSEGFDRTNRAIEDWLQASEYRAAHDYSLQVYDDRFRGMDDPASEMDIWVPVIRKQ